MSATWPFPDLDPDSGLQCVFDPDPVASALVVSLSLALTLCSPHPLRSICVRSSSELSDEAVDDRARELGDAQRRLCKQLDTGDPVVAAKVPSVMLQ